MNLYIPWDGWRLVRQLGQGSLGTVYEMAKKLAEAEGIRLERMRNRIPDPINY